MIVQLNCVNLFRTFTLTLLCYEIRRNPQSDNPTAIKEVIPTLIKRTETKASAELLPIYPEAAMGVIFPAPKIPATIQANQLI